MPLDIVLFREGKGGNPDLVRESQRRRESPVDWVDEVIEVDKECRENQYKIDQLNGDYKKINKEIAQIKKANENETPKELVEKAQAIADQIEHLKGAQKGLEEKLQQKLNRIGNIVHESVPVSSNEDNNAVIKKWGECKTQPKLLHHHELLEMIDGYESDPAGVEVAGHRGYFLKGYGVLLQLALVNYGVSFLTQKGYTPLIPPYFMYTKVMAKTAQLSQFDEELYKVGGEGAGEEEKCLIATSEQPISALHMNQWLEEKTLPKRYVGYSTCFRKEAGSHGRDAWGIFRVHQFDKIEQFTITTPEKSWEMHEDMLLSSEEFYQSLGIPYRVVSIVSGALNNAASKKYDLEGWFPTLATYRELVSCSNCTDYQSRALEIRCGMKKQGEAKKYVHMLNSTLCATTRTICAILENYQTEGGITVPAVLRPFMGGVELIPFVKDKPKRRAQPQAQPKVGQPSNA
eukprot:TRINITY_DN2901_c0_g1_i1.p1 TRINITY_DN2901_c0_g1~~TRINITY_DN2901_c0_g1_i1.p1  ORF type:complete len:460 (-),score=120.58 TRINITY_DN2901_c0_g1_i1:90-1469(-)